MSNPPNFSRAFDLSSLTKPKQEVPTQLPGFAITAATLQSELIPRSQHAPIIVAFYSQRHPESVAMLAMLGKLESEDKGAWHLGRVDIETEPQVAQAFQTKTLPYSVAIIKGQPIPLFESSYPEEQVRMVVNKVLSVAAEQGIGNAPEEKSEPEEDEAIAALERGDFDSAEGAYTRLLQRKPQDQYAKLGLAQVKLLKRTQGVNPEKAMEEAAKRPDDLQAQMRCADVEVVHGALQPAFDRLLRIISSTTGDERDQAKERLIELFSLVDPADPILIKARAQLASALF